MHHTVTLLHTLPLTLLSLILTLLHGVHAKPPLTPNPPPYKRMRVYHWVH